MSTARIKGGVDGAGYYHVMSRTVSDEHRGMMFFGAYEKNVFAKQLRKHAAFTGVEVLTWCMMDNHFHLLIRVPEKEEHVANLMIKGRKPFWQRLRAFYGRSKVNELRKEVDRLEKEKNHGASNAQRVKEILEGYTRRMADLSAFVRDLKRSFSIWFNRKHGREGTLWMDRFKSVLIEGEPRVLKKVSAYIDLNPIRAGLVKDPANYRWSGYGQAAGGNAEARRSLSLAHGYVRNEWKRISRAYRALLYLEGVEVRSPEGKILRQGVTREDYHRETSDGGAKRWSKRLSNRVRYFSAGAAIGSREFLESIFEKNRNLFGHKRKTGARKFRGVEWKDSDLYSLRDLSPE